MNISNSLKAALALVVLVTASALQAATVTVFAAASLTDCLQEIAANYQGQSGDKIGFNFAGSSVLERQIEEGAPADIFFSADKAKMNALEKKGLIDKATRRTRLSNSLVIVVAPNNPLAIHSPQDLAGGKVGHIALAEPQSVPAGIYAKKYLTRIHLWEKVAPKVVPLANVRDALAAVESGDADAGFVYKTDAAISKKTQVAYEVPRNEGPKISYPVAMIKASSEPKAAQSFLDYLESKAAAGVFVKFGFIVENK